MFFMKKYKKLNFGCGSNIYTGWDNVDIQQGSKITKSFDFDKFPYPIEDNAYNYIFSNMVLEHVDKPDRVIEELWRISKPNALIEIHVPHYSNKGAYNDMQHKHFFNENCFKNLITQRTRINKLKKFELIELKLTPTTIGKIFPKIIREKIALFINGLLSQIQIKFKVIKN